MLVRRELEGDRDAVRRVHAEAFARPGQGEPFEARLVDLLRASGDADPRLSLVALHDGAVVGHVVCSRRALPGAPPPLLGLGPLGVLPARQGRGVGHALVHAVLAAADALDEPAVVLLGAPAYYGRFGFAPAARHGVRSPEPAWGEHLQVRRLTAWSARCAGPFAFAPPFDEAPAP